MYCELINFSNVYVRDYFFFQAEDGIRDRNVTGVQTCALPILEKIEIKDEPAGIDCENCGHGMVYKMGRYGKFLACSNFPECRNTKPILKEIGIKCPKCKEGNVVERKSKKKRKFYGCDRFP